MKKIFFLFSALLFTAFLHAEKPIVRDIQTYPGSNGKINLTWSLPENPDKKITKLLIYRSSKIITNYSQLENLSPVATVSPESTGWTDTVTDLNSYFYTIISCIPSPYDLILLSVNTTSSGTMAKSKKANSVSPAPKAKKTLSSNVSRESPLPYIDFSEQTSTNLISEEATETLKSISKANNSDKNYLAPYFFEEDLISPDKGDDFLLFQILKTTFAPRKYSEAITQLTQLIGTNISEQTQNRAIFYIAESYYMLGQYEEAVRQFIRLQQIYPSLSKKWINSSLDNLN